MLDALFQLPELDAGDLGYRAALSNLRVTIEQQFSAGDRVATVSTIRGVHEGDLMGTPPTGREVVFGMITISRFEDVRIAEDWTTGRLPGG